MTNRILLDTGSLVAILHAKDQHHKSCIETSFEWNGRMLTCWPVITEAAWLLRADAQSIIRMLYSIRDATIQLLELDATAAGWIATFLERYRDLGAQLADAALMYLAERHGIETVFTLDRRDFSVYRLPDGRALHIVPAP